MAYWDNIEFRRLYLWGRGGIHGYNKVNGGESCCGGASLIGKLRRRVLQCLQHTGQPRADMESYA